MKGLRDRNNIRKITAGLCLAVIVVLFFSGTVTGVQAISLDDGAGQAQAGTSEGDGEDDKNVSIFHYILNFPFETLKDALVNSMVGIMGDFLGGTDVIIKSNEPISAIDSMTTVVDTSIGWMINDTVNEQTRYASWRVMLRISLILVPLSLILTMAGAMKEGVSSVISYANAREAITEWVISIALMASSYYLINLALKGSGYISVAIFEMMMEQPELTSSYTLGRALLRSFIASRVMYLAAPVVNMFLFFFNIFGVVSLIGSIVLSTLAQGVGVIVATALAPLIYVISALRPFSWLKGMWLKLLVVLILLPPVNMLLLTIGATLIVKAYAGTGSGFGNSLLGILTMVGVVSVVITVNATVGKMVYGAAIDIAKKAWGATKTVIAAMASVAGFAAAPAIAGAMGGAGAAGAGVAGAGVAGTGAAGTGAAGAGAGEAAKAATTMGSGAQSSTAMMGNPMASFGKNPEVNQMANQLSNMLSQSNNPVLRGMGNGMNARSAFDSMKTAQRQSDSTNEWLRRQPAEINRGFNAAAKMIESNWSNPARSSNEGVNKARVVFDAAALRGQSVPAFLQESGWLEAAGGNVELAMSNATQYYGMAHHGFSSIADSSNTFRGFSAPVQSEHSALHQAAVYTSTHNNGYRFSNDPAELLKVSNAMQMAASRPGSAMGKVVDHMSRIGDDAKMDSFLNDQIRKTAGHS